MKKTLTILIAGVLAAATCCLALTGCGGDKKKTNATEATKAPTVAATVAPTTAPTVAATLAPQEQSTYAPEDDDDTQAPEATDAQDDGDNSGLYGGMTYQDAILSAMNYAGSGYQCVSYDQRYRNNQEAWYVGLQATDGTDATVYYVYVNSDGCVPQSNIPSRGSNTVYAGISQNDAQSTVLNSLGGTDDLEIVSVTQSYYGDDEAWLIMVSDADGTTYTAYVGDGFCEFV